MCTIVFGWQLFAEAPVVVAANRDERLDREATSPAVRGTNPRILAPRDEEAGGTWMGVNEHRLFAGLTNRWLEERRSAERSRGLLLDDVLETSSAEAAVDVVREAVAEHDYDGFNVLLADRETASLLEYDGTLAVREFDPGVHVVVNTGADGEYAIPEWREEIASEQAANADRVREVLAPRADETPVEWLDRGKAVLGDHEYGVCIHGDGYGSVSTSLIAIRADGGVQYAYADGPPCETEAVPVDGHI